MLNKIAQHLRDGTLLTVATNKIRNMLMRRRSTTDAVGDSYYGQKAATYLQQRINQPVWEAEQRAMRNLLSRLPDRISVLDVPFGTGRFVPYYLEKTMSVSGLDASADMLKAARQALGESVLSCDLRTGDARALPYPDQAFDLVVSFRFLQTMIGSAETPIVLRELHRVTRSYAILELKVRHDHVPRPQRSKSEPMTFQLNDSEIRQLLDDVGFFVQEVEVIGSPDSKYSDLAMKHAYLCGKRK